MNSKTELYERTIWCQGASVLVLFFKTEAGRVTLVARRRRPPSETTCDVSPSDDNHTDSLHRSTPRGYCVAFSSARLTHADLHRAVEVFPSPSQ